VFSPRNVRFAATLTGGSMTTMGRKAALSLMNEKARFCPESGHGCNEFTLGAGACLKLPVMTASHRDDGPKTPRTRTP
jgi:hypothetical protein